MLSTLTSILTFVAMLAFNIAVIPIDLVLRFLAVVSDVSEE